MILLFWQVGSFEYNVIFESVTSGVVSNGMLTLIALLIFVGAVGKSGQFPLHTWLPDAMEGPTPVSALIHAATMVAAGVYLVATLFPLFEASETALLIIAIIGGFTAIFAASIALTQKDIKRVLAYSTVSQLGYMMLALGSSGYVAGVFHLTTHAFFKALLFLAAGSVIHAVHTQDIEEMGGLWKKLPKTGLLFLIGTMAISGVPLLSGFFSKDVHLY
jgi:NADH-quinone oxidoreductase subunit L